MSKKLSEKGISVEQGVPSGFEPIPGTKRWLKSHEISLSIGDKKIGKIVFDEITLTDFRPAQAAFYHIDRWCQTDWELPLSYIDGKDLPEELMVGFGCAASGAPTKHILIVDISIDPSYRCDGLARFLVASVGKNHPDAQSIWILPEPYNDEDEIYDSDGLDDFDRLIINSEKPSELTLSRIFCSYGFLTIETGCGVPLMVKGGGPIVCDWTDS